MGDAAAPELGCHVAPDPRLAAYYHQAAVGASSVQQHLAIVDTKLAGLSRTADVEVRLKSFFSSRACDVSRRVYVCLVINDGMDRSLPVNVQRLRTLQA